MAYGWPCDPNTEISQNFAANPNNVQPDGHTGMDFALSEGSPLYAIGGGTVLVADWVDSVLGPNNVYGIAVTSWLGRSAGICVIIDHGDIISISAHMSETGLNAGDSVGRGQRIGSSGSTGYAFGPHLHFEIMKKPLRWAGIRWYGRSDPLNYISKGTAGNSLSTVQRLAVEGANYRPEPNTSKDPTQTFSGGDVLNFVGFVHGEKVGNSDIWLKGIGGGYVHISAVQGSSTAGLPDLTPKPVTPPPPAPVNPAARTVGSNGANQRSEPNTSSTVTGSLEAGFTFVAKGWVKGEAPEGDTNRIWFVGSVSGNYVWSGACTDSSIGSLPDLTPKAVPAPVTPPKPVTPTPVPPVVSKPSPVVVAPPVTVPVVPSSPVLKAELACVTEVVPAHPDNYQVGNFPTNPTHIVIHQFGSKGVHLGSVKNYFAMSLADRQKADKKAGPTSAHFGGEETSLVQFVSLKNRAYGAGPQGNNFVHFETGPDQSPATIATVRKGMRAINDYFGYPLIPILHKDIPGNVTECGNDIDLSNYQNVGLTPKTSDKTVKEQMGELFADFSSKFSTLIGKL